MRGERSILVLLVAGALTLIACTVSTDGSDDFADPPAEGCEGFDDPMACEDAVESCGETPEAEECTDAVYDCAQTDEPLECTQTVQDCTRSSDPEVCVESYYDCLESEDAMECPFAESSPAPMTILDQINLNEGQHLRGQAEYMPGRCGGSAFMSPIRMTNGPPLMMIQIQGGREQRTEGHLLSNGITLVFVDDEPSYDEFYIITSGRSGDPMAAPNELRGLTFYGPDGTLPDFGDIPRLDPMLIDAMARDAIFGGPRDVRGLVQDLGWSNDVCDLGFSTRVRPGN